MSGPWPEVPLGELMATKSRSVNPANSPEQRFVLYSIPAFDEGQPECVAGSEVGSSKQRLQPGDVLLSKIVPHIRRVWHVNGAPNESLIGSSEWIVFRTEHAAPEYLRHLLRSDPVHARFMQTVSGVGGSLLRARPALVADISVPLPPLEEQRRIARILDAADDLRAKRRRSLELLDSLTESIFQNIGLGCGKADSPPLVPLAELADVQGGLQVTRRRSRNPIEVPYLRVANVHRGGLDLDEVKTMRVTAAELQRVSLRSGDLLVVEGHGNSNEIGRVARWGGEIDQVVHQNHLIRARLDKRRLSPRLCEAFLNSPVGRRSLLRAARTTSGLNTISTSDVRSVLVPVPAPHIQRRFDQLLEKFDALERRTIAGEERLDELFASLQQRAFRGDL